MFLHDKCFESLYISSKTSWLREGRRAFKAARGTLLAYKSLLAARACHVCKKHRKSKHGDRRDVGPRGIKVILFRFGLFYMFCFVLFYFFLKVFNLKSMNGWLFHLYFDDLELYAAEFHAFRQTRRFEEHLVSANLFFDTVWSSDIFVCGS